MNSLVNYSSDDEKDNRYEENDRRKVEAMKDDIVTSNRHNCDRKSSSSSKGHSSKKDISSRSESSEHRSSYNRDKGGRHQRNHREQKEKERIKTSSSHKSERYREKSRERNRDKDRDKFGDYDYDRRNSSDFKSSKSRSKDDYSRDNDRKEKRSSYESYHRDKSHRRRRSASPKDKKDSKQKESQWKAKEPVSNEDRTVSVESKDLKVDSETKNRTVITNLFNTTANNDNADGKIVESPVPPELSTSNSSLKLPSYYNPAVVNSTKFAEQIQKRKLLWSNKKDEECSAAKWGGAKFSEDSDGKVASKFMRLMGIKNAPKTNEDTIETKATDSTSENIKQREKMFSSMEQQYEVARQATHTMRGVGLGFGSQNRPF